MATATRVAGDNLLPRRTGGERGAGWRGVTGGSRLGSCQGSGGDKVTAVPGTAVLPAREGTLLPVAGGCIFPQDVEEFSLC